MYGYGIGSFSFLNSGIAVDADALAYFEANTAITLDADKIAIDAFYKGLKADGIYTKMKAMYLPKWASATNDKWNLVNPVDTSEAFRLKFNGGWTHSTSGILGNGSNTYAETYIIPSSVLTNNNTHLSYYCRSNTYGAIIDFGTQSGGSLSVYNYLSSYYSDQYDTGGGRASSAISDTRGFISGSRTSASVHKLFRNGVQTGATNTGSSGGLTSINNSIFFGAGRASATTAFLFSNRQYSFASCGDGLTDADEANLYNRVQTLMTYFGINV